MPIVDQNRLKGNYAESLVASWLSQSCLVRPVAEGTDIGVDLYCEAIIDSTPFIHFWAQVKAINPERLSSDGESATYPFEATHLAYWAQQPIPVYAFLVPIETWPPELPNRIYGVRITEYIVRHGLPIEKTKAIASSGYFDKESLESDLDQFIKEIVPWDASANQFQRGIISPIIKPVKEKQSHFPSGIGYVHLPKVLINLRDASVMALVEALTIERQNFSFHQLRKDFQAIASLFQDQIHDLGVSALVRAAYIDGDYDHARDLVATAFRNILNDPTEDSCSKRHRLQRLRFLLEDIDEAA